eukprot:COSAG06_NODE_5350_length_3532_cov_40.227789_3_plen_79_part_00
MVMMVTPSCLSLSACLPIDLCLASDSSSVSYYVLTCRALVQAISTAAVSFFQGLIEFKKFNDRVARLNRSIQGTSTLH